jgi:hypothetical protein
MSLKNNRIKRLLWFISGGAFLALLLLLDFYQCPIKFIFHIPCPGCGMSRAFIAIIELRLVDAFNLNILSIPLFIGLAIVGTLFIVDIILSTNYSDRILYIKLKPIHYGILFALTLLSWTMNIIRGI